MVERQDACVKGLLKEARDSYVLAMKHAITLYSQLNPADNDRYVQLRMATQSRLTCQREFGMVRRVGSCAWVCCFRAVQALTADAAVRVTGAGVPH